MEIYQEYGLATVKAIPKWIAKVPFLRRLWFNPVFQRNYRNSRVRKLIEPKRALLIGLIGSFFYTTALITISIFMNNFEFYVGGSYLIPVPIAFVFLGALIRMFFVCLVSTPREFQQDIRRDDPNSILTIPISTESLFFAEILPNFVRGLEDLLSILALAVGTALPFFSSLLIIVFTGVGITIFNFTQISAFTIIIAFVMFATYVLITLLISITVGAYAVSMTIFGAITATLFQLSIVLIIAGGCMARAATALGWLAIKNLGITYLGAMNPSQEIIWGYSLAIIHTIIGTIIIFWACLFTSHIGISALAKARRVG